MRAIRAARPSFVLSAASAAVYFNKSSRIRNIDKSAPGAFLSLAGIAYRFAALLARYAGPRHRRS